MSDLKGMKPIGIMMGAILICVIVTWGFYTNRVEATKQKAETADEEERYSDEAEALLELARLEPWRKELPGMAAGAFFLAGDFDNAAVWYSKALASMPLGQTAKFQYGLVLSRIGKPEEARSVLSSINPLLELTGPETQELSQVWRNLGNPEVALYVLEEWLSNGDLPATEMGWDYAVLSAVLNSESALPVIMSVSSDIPQLREKLTPLITILNSTGHKDPARWTGVGRYLFENLEWDLAEIAFNKVIHLKPSDSESWAMLGQSKLMQGKEGYPDLVKAIEINDRSRLGRYFLAKYWRDRGQVSISRNYLESLSSEEPREPLWLLELGKTAYAAGDTSGALEYFQSAANLDQDNLTSWQSLAEFCLLNGIDLEGTGETAVQRSLLIAPDDPVSNDLMGWLLLSRGDPDNALKFLKKSVAAENSSARSRLHLAQAFWGVGDAESARQEFQAALTLDLEGSVGLAAGRLLNQYFPGN